MKNAHIIRNIYHGTLINSSINIQQALRDSYNNAGNISKSDVKDKIRELIDQIAGIIGQKDYENSAAMKESLELFVKEVAKPEPRRKWLELTSETLIDSARSAVISSKSKSIETNIKTILGMVVPRIISESTGKSKKRYYLPARLVYSYSYKDESLRDGLEVHLKPLKRQGYIDFWNDRRILPGQDWASEIDENFKTADIILLLVSPDFIASDYCYGTELLTAIRLHDAKKAHVIPIFLRPCDWIEAPFAKL